MVVLCDGERAIVSERLEKCLNSVGMLIALELRNSFRFIGIIVVDKSNSVFSWDVTVLNCVAVKNLGNFWIIQNSLRKFELILP